MLNNFLAYLAVSSMNIITDIKRREEGQGLVEYALILVLVSIVSIALLAALGVKIGDVFSDITTKL